jgi:hypothetical protein
MADALTEQREEASVEGFSQVRCGDRLIAMIISREFRACGIHFFTPHEFSQQLAYMAHPTGTVIAPHVHNRVSRQVQYTQEVLLIRKGRLRVDFYDEHQRYVQSRVLQAGDVILLIEGGHGFEVLEEIEMIEVKQGPYVGPMDKTVLTSAFPTKLKFQ